jgi:beta-galactosidase GanA
MIKLDWKAVVAAGGAVVVLYVLGKREAMAAAEAVGDYVTSTDNHIYTGVGGVVDAIDPNESRKGQPLGARIYEWEQSIREWFK